MGRFKSVGQAQRFLSAFEPTRGHFHPHQHKQSASEYRAVMSQQIESGDRSGLFHSKKRFE